jgi:hypothetical protein
MGTGEGQDGRHKLSSVTCRAMMLSDGQCAMAAYCPGIHEFHAAAAAAEKQRRKC